MTFLTKKSEETYFSQTFAKIYIAYVTRPIFTKLNTISSVS